MHAFKSSLIKKPGIRYTLYLIFKKCYNKATTFQFTNKLFLVAQVLTVVEGLGIITINNNKQSIKPGSMIRIISGNLLTS